MNLALLAPSARCNQHCPDCAITEIFREPVRPSHLRATHYARFVSDLASANVPLSSVSFLGYEVTLPDAWPYVEAAFLEARRQQIRRSFITNGMLLHKWSERIKALEPHQITISIDGATAAVNDPLRGLPGAFAATLSSLERFLRRAPSFRPRVAIASTLFSDANAGSLRAMPALMASRGLTRWILGAALSRDGTRVNHLPTEKLHPWLLGLCESAADAGVRPHFVDLANTGLDGIPGLHVKKPGGLENVLRLDPNGTIRSGAALMMPYHSQGARRWDPERESAAVAAGLAPAATSGLLPSTETTTFA